MTDVAVTLNHWYTAIWGDRWTIRHENRPVLTFPTKREALDAARENGWVIASGDVFAETEGQG